MQEIITKAGTLLEALPYIQRFRGEVFVVKYGGSFMDSPDSAERHRVAREIVFLEAVGINPVVVHGGGKAVTRAVEAAGLTTAFLQGQRVTDETTVKLVDDVLSREINPEIVAAIEALGGRARGFAGTEIFRCRKFSPNDENGNPIDLGFVGEVSEVNVAPLRECIRRGVTPVISPTARGDDGRLYNCHADVPAAPTSGRRWSCENGNGRGDEDAQGRSVERHSEIISRERHSDLRAFRPGAGSWRAQLRLRCRRKTLPRSGRRHRSLRPGPCASRDHRRAARAIAEAA